MRILSTIVSLTFLTTAGLAGCSSSSTTSDTPVDQGAGGTDGGGGSGPAGAAGSAQTGGAAGKGLGGTAGAAGKGTSGSAGAAGKGTAGAAGAGGSPSPGGASGAAGVGAAAGAAGKSGGAGAGGSPSPGGASGAAGAAGMVTAGGAGGTTGGAAGAVAAGGTTGTAGMAGAPAGGAAGAPAGGAAGAPGTGGTDGSQGPGGAGAGGAGAGAAGSAGAAAGAGPGGTGGAAAGASGASGAGGGLPMNEMIGATCQADLDCSGGHCITPDSTELNGAGPASGYCSFDCTAFIVASTGGQTIPDPCDPGKTGAAVCLNFGTSMPVGRCIQTCQFGVPAVAPNTAVTLSPNKCNGRPDVDCQGFYGANGVFTDVSICLPRCAIDTDCNPGQKCDNVSGGCVASLPPNLVKNGGACDPTACATSADCFTTGDTCVGGHCTMGNGGLRECEGACVGLYTDPAKRTHGICLDTCEYGGSQAACGGKTTGFCGLFNLYGPPQLCTVDTDCTAAGDKCVPDANKVGQCHKGCTADSNCPNAGDTCTNGACTSSTSQMTTGGGDISSCGQIVTAGNDAACLYKEGWFSYTFPNSTITTCLPATPCTTNANCDFTCTTAADCGAASGDTCVGGVCQKNGKPDSGALSCQAVASLKTSYCLDHTPPPLPL